jgi:hypothetical protein
MTRTIMAAALALAVALPAISAHAAARDRVFVASYGSDSNPCTFGSPCKTFQQAVNVVADSGEVTAIDSAGFGPINITRGVTITSPNGVEAGVVAAAGGTAITINATGAVAVILRGLTLEGANSANYGIVANTAAKIEIIDCVVRDFSQDGIYVSLGAQTLIHISNTKVMNNANVGIFFKAYTSISNGDVSANLDHLTVVDNNNSGISIGSQVWATITNSNISNNGCDLSLTGDGLGPASATLRNVMLLGENGGCSVAQHGNSWIFMSQITGGITSSAWSQDGTNNRVLSDLSNVIDVGSSPVSEWAPLQ